jgi:hypothetical protein
MHLERRRPQAVSFWVIEFSQPTPALQLSNVSNAHRKSTILMDWIEPSTLGAR